MRISKLSWIEILNNHEECFDLHKMEAFSKFIQMKFHITVDPRDPFIAFLCIEDAILKERLRASKSQVDAIMKQHYIILGGLFFFSLGLLAMLAVIHFH